MRLLGLQITPTPGRCRTATEFTRENLERRVDAGQAGEHAAALGVTVHLPRSRDENACHPRAFRCAPTIDDEQAPGGQCTHHAGAVTGGYSTGSTPR